MSKSPILALGGWLHTANSPAGKRVFLFYLTRRQKVIFLFSILEGLAGFSEGLIDEIVTLNLLC